ncbi:MAG: urate hydroxylase PuuD [Stellaceae bacterium]
MSSDFLEWANLFVRWFHVIVGIGWIGTSFFFMALDAHLTLAANAKKHSTGKIWLIHSGGYYEVEKLDYVPPGQIPFLHWFKWEAYLTGISGLMLLFIVYYFGGGLMVDPNVAHIGHWESVGIGIAAIAGGWALYEVIWRSPLNRFEGLMNLFCFLLLVAMAYGLSLVLSGRAAYMHVGAMMGIIMVANVLVIIQPSQRRMVRANRAGQVPDPAWGHAAKQRSVHNNYLTLPVVFVMISNHFPNTYAEKWNWAILIALFLVGAGVRYFLNTYDGGSRVAPYVLGGAVAAAIVLALVTTVPMSGGAVLRQHVSFAEADAVIGHRCVECHSAHPSDNVYHQAPMGIRFDTAHEIAGLVPKIKLMAVDTEAMPLGNKTGMTPHERALLRAWLAEGAPLD